MEDLRDFLERATRHYNTVAFIESDPIRVPHCFEGLQDREIAGFWAATLAWGQRKTIIQSALRAMELMDWSPHEFVLGHNEAERERFARFYHRTFQPTDALYFLEFFQNYYRRHASLETAFARHMLPGDATVERALVGFHRDFFDHPWAPERTRKHIPTPERGATCKRLNMFLRWMVRRDTAGVDFGIWRQIQPSQLLLPLDVHVDRVARQLGLLHRRQTDWRAVLELTDALRAFDPDDPTKYDFALFGLSARLEMK
ncbi:MAG: TIGR02757 family protein [Saprospiraceae bacterium]|nr:TIGR02757 family protein [Saprospiraceae bacterium]MDW8230381.1 TIGR02757 family protein [Saprospiraceae bacterium]